MDDELAARLVALERERQSAEALMMRVYDRRIRDRESYTSIDTPFFTELDKVLIREFSGALANYCAEENIERVAYMDRRGRAIYHGVNEYWCHAYPDRPRPETYFFNPSGFKVAGYGASQAMLDRRAQEVANQLETAGSPLLERKEEPLLLMDSCTHSGETLFWTQEMLRRIGFSNVKTGAFIDHRADFYAIVQCDFTVTEEPAIGCSPFGGDLTLETKANSIFATLPETSPADLSAFRGKLRREIREAVREGFEEES